MNIFDTTELEKKLSEAEANFGKEEIKEEVKEEIKEVAAEEDLEASKTEEVAEEEIPLEEEEEEELPKDSKDARAWKKIREKSKAAKAEAETQKKLAEEKDKQLSELRERLARLEGREEARVKPKIEEDSDPEPDVDLDPDQHIRWTLRQTNKRIEAAERRAQMAEEMAKVEGVRRGLDMVEKEYIKSNKLDDYDAAITHIKNVNKKLIKLEYPEATDAQIDAHLENERLKHASMTYSKGKNPAQYFYEMAQTLGYEKSKKSNSTKPNIDSINNNMRKNANLIGSSNNDNTGSLSAETVAKMSIDQLLKKEGSNALDEAIRRAEAKMMGL